MNITFGRAIEILNQHTGRFYSEADSYDKMAGDAALQFIKTGSTEKKEEALRLSTQAATTRRISESLRKSLYDAFREIEAEG